jgi:hypothetical protein
LSQVAILIVNGFDRGNQWGTFDTAEADRFPWIAICLRQIERHTATLDYSVEIWDNSRLGSHAAAMAGHQCVSVHRDHGLPRGAAQRLRGGLSRHLLGRPSVDVPHAVALDMLLGGLSEDVDFVVTLDSDAFPVADGWLEVLIGELEGGATLAGIYRNEMEDAISPFIHVSCLAARRLDLKRLGVSFGEGKDVGQGLTQAVLAEGGRIAPLRRSNKVNYHFLMGGVYGDLVYHQGAGSRRARFWTSRHEDAFAEEQTRLILRDRAFGDLDGLISELTSRRYPHPL